MANRPRRRRLAEPAPARARTGRAVPTLLTPRRDEFGTPVRPLRKGSRGRRHGQRAARAQSRRQRINRAAVARGGRG